jgi:hypothetical protein
MFSAIFNLIIHNYLYWKFSVSYESMYSVSHIYPIIIGHTS